MPRWLLLILGVLILYLSPALLLKAVYGPSYNIFPVENGWVPDENGGWQPLGFPDQARPATPSEKIPFLVRIAPIILPIFLVMLFLLSPLARYVEREPGQESSSFKPEKYYPDFVEESSRNESGLD